MAKGETLEEKLKNLKLKKRQLVLAGKDTKKIDDMIKELDEMLIRANEAANEVAKNN